MKKPDCIGIVLFVLLLASIAGSGCVDNSVNQTAMNNVSAVVYIPTEHTPFQSTPDPNTVPVATAYNQTLSTFWSFALDGPYATNANWTTSALDPEPSIIYDVNGEPLYYEFYLRNSQGIPGYFWTAANKILGFPVFRIYEGAPARNYSIRITDAEPVVKSRYPDYPVLSRKPVIYNEPQSGVMFTIHNTTSGTDEKIVVDDHTHEIVPDQPSENFKGHGYAWSYLDSIPQAERESRIARWELQDSNASRIVEYVLVQGIDVRLPLSDRNASIIRNYSATQSPEPAATPDDAQEKQNDLPVTDEIIRKNIVPVDTARDRVLADLWRRQVNDPEIYRGLSYRDAIISSKDPVIIQDFQGRKLYYAFDVERNGTAIRQVIVTANKGLFSHRFGLETSAGEYHLTNATREACDRAVQEFPGYSVLSIRPVYSVGVSCCHNVSIITDVENPATHETNRILVDTYTLSASVEKVTGNTVTDTYPSIFSMMPRGEYAENINLWEKEDKKNRDFIVFAKSRNIPTVRPLTDTEIVALGTYLFKSEPRYQQEGKLYNPLYPQPAVRPTLDKATQVWHEQADWFSAILVDASLDKTEIEQITKSHLIPGNYTIRILSSGAMGADYYLDVPEADYNRTFSILEQDGSVEIREQVAPMWEYVQIVKRKDGLIIIPVAIGYPKEANAKRLIAAGVPLRPMREVYIQYDYTAMPKKADREKILAELNADDRVLFAFKEYSG
jgi:hypothetical protein